MRKGIRHWLVRLNEEGEKGQSIIILALAVVVLLGFVGIAIDVGRLYGTRIQLSRAVDAAALAGVLELPELDDADSRARQFMRTNGYEPGNLTVWSVTSGGGVSVSTSRYLTVTAQLPMETMFLRFVGWETVEVPALAVAEYKSPLEVYASQHPESGVVGAVNLSVFGKDSNPQYGDAFMGTHWSGEGGCSGVTPSPNPYWRELEGKYPFRIYVPAGYQDLEGGREVQVEILDPDCWNTDQNTFDIPWVVTPTIDYGMLANNPLRGSVAVVESNDANNELWQVRMDQYLDFCGSGGSPMTTRYTLYYYKQDDLTKYPIAVYEQGLDSSTDLTWVVPGETPGVDTESGSFLFDISDYPEVMTDEGGNMSFFIDIEGLAGTYGNGFDLWAGPPPTDTVPSNVNERNVYLLRKILFEDTNPHDSSGVVIWAIGYLPLNVNTETAFTVTLGYIPPQAAGANVSISSWDMDRYEEGSPCYCRQAGHNCLGLSLNYYLEGVPTFREGGTVSCSTKWANDVFQIPHEFYGGYLYAVYHTSQQDTTDWKLEYLDVMDDSYVRLIR
jgi:hypothetical protein